MNRLLIYGVLGLACAAVSSCASVKNTQTAMEEDEQAYDYIPNTNEMGQHFNCPVEHVPFTVNTLTPAAKYKGETYFFNSKEARSKFKANPERYAREDD